MSIVTATAAGVPSSAWIFCSGFVVAPRLLPGIIFSGEAARVGYDVTRVKYGARSLQLPRGGRLTAVRSRHDDGGQVVVVVFMGHGDVAAAAEASAPGVPVVHHHHWRASAG